MTSPSVTIVGGGLAGSELALFLAQAGVSCRLVEMRPERRTPAHETSDLAELVCSNSLRSNDPLTAAGMLKEELALLESPLLALAVQHEVPAGSALAVDRRGFSQAVTAAVGRHPLIRLERHEVTRIPGDPCVILAPGPLASHSLMQTLSEVVGKEHLFFFDAIAPIVDADSLDMDRLFSASRYDKGDADYLNSPVSREQYFAFVDALIQGEKFVPHGFDATDKLPLFQGCQPVEAIAASGPRSLSFGPMKPKGIVDPVTGRMPYAIVQLRAENRQRTAFNLVGFQTRLVQSEQRRIFRMIPGLERAEFLRYGALHRNSYLDGPRVLNLDLSLKADDRVHVAGQFAGAEGYIESLALGHLCARFVLSKLRGQPPHLPPPETAIGSLWHHVTQSTTCPLEPSNVHLGLLPPVDVKGKRPRRQAMLERGRVAMGAYVAGAVLRYPQPRP